ncbi:MAG TPA: ABC transporter permease [Bryobacteraceae bacterium]|nr:ABC transporter permease [Bryobacteraceae bacterium]
MPDWRREIESRLAGLHLAPTREAEIVDELALYLADRHEEFIALGIPEAEAYRRALAELEEKPMAAILQESERAPRLEPVILGTRRRSNWMGDMVQDIRYGMRSLLSNGRFTIVALIALALGIGANTAVFSVFNGVLLNPLPYPQPNRLVWLWPADARTGEEFHGAISPPDFVDYRKQNSVFEQLSAFTPMDLNLTGGVEPERIAAVGVSAGFFETLGTPPALGRTFRPDDEQVSLPQTAILSDGLWRRRFGADPRIVGQNIVLDGRNVQVVGVMPPEFTFPKEVQLWQTLPFGRDELKVRRFHFLRVIGRLKSGVTLEQAQAQMKSICAVLAKTYPASNSEYSSHVVSLQEQIVGELRPTLTVLMIAVGFVLLISCANVAHLLLARATARRREIAIRASLGASMGRVMRQLLTESVLLGVFGGGLGIILAIWGLKGLRALHAVGIPRLDEVHLDGRVLAFTAALSILTGVLFGIFPALRTARPQLVETLKAGGHGATLGRAHHRFHSALVMAEVAIALVLLAGAGLMVRSFQTLQNVDPGFQPNEVLAMQISLPGGQHFRSQQAINFYRSLLDRLKNLPGVGDAGLVSELPLSGQNNDTWFKIEGRRIASPNDRSNADQRLVSPSYFKAMGIPLAQGRFFTEADNENGAKVVIVDQRFAEKFFPHQNPVGQHLTIDIGQPFQGEIVGVVGAVRHRALAQSAYQTMYIPVAQSAMGHANIVIRGHGDVLTLANAVKQQVQAVNHDVPIFGVQTMGELVSESVGRPRFRTLLLGLFAAVALMLAAAGIYGVMSYSVSLRTHELGIRMALGAEQRDITTMVVGRGMLLVLGGIAIGLAASFGLARFISSMLFRIRPTDPVSFIAVALVLALVAFLANYLPARRATKVDAMVALRCE